MRTDGPPTSPVFVLGGRGGQRLAALLDQHPHLCGVPNSGLLTGLVDLVETNFESLVHYGLPDQYWRSAVARFLAGLQERHTIREGKTRWVEWVPSSRLSVSDLDRFFPRAQLIRVAERRPCRAGRHLRRERHAAARLAPGRYLKVDDADLLTQPERSLRDVLRFLGEPWSDAAAPLAIAGRVAGSTRRRDPEVIDLVVAGAEPERPAVGRRP